jgi:hypothetical protein
VSKVPSAGDAARVYSANWDTIGGQLLPRRTHRIIGLVASSLFDLPTDAVIVCTLVIAFGVATMLARGEAVPAPRAATRGNFPN